MFEIGGPSGFKLDITAANEAKCALTKVQTDAGYCAILSEVDDGSVTGTPTVRSPETSADYRLRCGIDTMSSSWQFPGTAIDTTIWTAPVTTMTITVGNGFVTLNAGSSIAANAVARLSSWKAFPSWGSFTTWLELNAQFSSAPVPQSVCEWGFIIATGTATPTDGSFFRINSSGEFRAVLNYNGTEIQSDTIDFATLVGVNTTRTFLIGLHNTSVTFWIDDVLVAEFQLPPAAAAMNSAVELPVTIRNYNTAIAPTDPQQIRVGACNVTLGEYHGTKQHEQIMAGMGACCYQGQTGGTLGSTAANIGNSAALPAAAVPTNTTAALGSGLGGYFHELEGASPPAPASGVDAIIMSYQVPAIATNSGNKMLYVTGIVISSSVDATIIGGGYMALWQVAFGGTAVSLATAESATSKAYRKMPLDQVFIPANAAVGTVFAKVERQFSTPIPVYPGEFLAIVKRKLGTVPTGPTGSQIHAITVVGYFE